MQQNIDSRQILYQKQQLSYHQRFELDVLEISSMDLNEMIQKELESNPFLEQDMCLETGHIRKEETNFELLLNYVVKEKTLSEELHEQVRWYDKDLHIDLAIFITDMLDSNGYLNYTNKELLKYFPQYDTQEVEKTIKIIQTMEPAGVAARSLSECLLIQLSKMEGTIAEIAKRIADGYLEEVALNHIDLLAKQTNTTTANIQRAIDLIKSLDPKPGSKYSNTASYLYPDLFCFIEDSKIHLELMNDTYGLHVNKLPKTDYEECRSWYRNATNLVSAIKKRNQTLLKVGNAICEFQKDYFLYSTGLKPCSMKQIADICNVHESTVSRCVADKSMIFNNQVIPLKYFFPRGLADDSVIEIQELIHDLVRKEDPYHPLSDEKISQMLAELDYQISRRTIAKYREKMNIPSSSKRKRKD